MADYAKGTTVPVDKTLRELEKLLTDHGATAYGYTTAATHRSVMFQLGARTVRYTLATPSPHDHGRTGTGKARTADSARSFAAAEDRRRWRELHLLVKALLVAVSSGIVNFEDAFLAPTVLPDGRAVGDVLAEQLTAAGYTAALPPVDLALPAAR